MSLANWYVFYSYEWYATWTAFISLTNTVSMWMWDCWNAIIEAIPGLTHVMIHFRYIRVWNEEPVVHFPYFCTIKASIYIFNVHIFHGVWQGEAIAWTSFTITHVYWILERVLLFLFFMLMMHSLNFHHTAISV